MADSTREQIEGLLVSAAAYVADHDRRPAPLIRDLAAALLDSLYVRWCETEEDWYDAYDGGYYVRCTQPLPHTDHDGEHYDSNTGHSWPRSEAEKQQDRDIAHFELLTSTLRPTSAAPTPKQVDRG